MSPTSVPTNRIALSALRLAVVAGLTSPLLAQTVTCNMVRPCGGSIPCRGGCSAPVVVSHFRSAPCAPGAGGIDLSGTEYESTSATGRYGCPIAVPPLRLWLFDNYAGANSGCQRQDDPTGPWMANTGCDDGSPLAGQWYLFQGNWQGSAIDGCFSNRPPPAGGFRTVAEVSFPDAQREGRSSHRSCT